MRAASHRRRTSGFTLIEMLVAIGISMVVMAAATKFFTYQLSVMRGERSRRAAQMTARTALDFVARQIEQLGRDPGRSLFRSLDNSTLAPALATAGATSINYRTNLSADEDDADTLDDWENVTFSVADGVFWVAQGDDDPLPLSDETATMAHVPDDGLAFTYFDGWGAQVPNLATDAARASVRRITVSLTVVGGPADGGANAPSVTLSQDVYLRNLS